ncbi:putative Zn finger-like uncharacterized protein [Paraburkholderia sp. GAS41]|jgi:predicted Zn finger-like uncharacterized protein|uniref:zinc-ribbon and DUF3426 domain-containing protein n=1 Tax=Paraburkholderia sp. GAS41 TaxID=3035134 RepID=UPI003D1CEE74
MLLATRCPFCETVFRLDPAQLALRRGLVRCGHCQEVFDASSSLYDAAEGTDFTTATPISPAELAALTADRKPKVPNFSAEAWNPWAPQADAAIDNRLLHNANNLPLAPVAASVAVTPRHADEPAMPSAHEADNALHREPAFASEVDPEPVSAEERIAHETVADDATVVAFAHDAAPSWRQPQHPVEPLEDEPGLQDARAAAATLRSAPDSEPHFGGAAATAFAANPPAADDPFAVVRETRAPAPRQVGWRVVGTVVTVILAVGLLAQLAWWQRETIMVDWPDSQALYSQACAPLGCSVTPPHDIDGLQVEPSDLRQIDGPHKLELKMPLRNRYNVALAYPAIELTLLDDQNNVAMRRVLWPQDYVKPGTPITAGLQARTTETMVVHLDTGNAVASNFRVQIFYP